MLDGYKLSPVVDGLVTYFDFIGAGELRTLNRGLHDLADNGRSTNIGDEDLKMGAVGFRPGEKYGDPKMFGFEIRTINQERNPDWKPYVNAVQKGVLTASYGLSRTALERWHEANVGALTGRPGEIVYRQNLALTRLHYQKPVDDALGEIPAALTPLASQAEATIRANGDKIYGLKMLVHDWNNDPALADDPGLQAHVLSVQKAELAELGGRPMSEPELHALVKDFVSRSGLYEAFAKSLGMRDPAVASPNDAGKRPSGGAWGQRLRHWTAKWLN